MVFRAWWTASNEAFSRKTLQEQVNNCRSTVLDNQAASGVLLDIKSIIPESEGYTREWDQTIFSFGHKMIIISHQLFFLFVSTGSSSKDQVSFQVSVCCQGFTFRPLQPWVILQYSRAAESKMFECQIKCKAVEARLAVKHLMMKK